MSTESFNLASVLEAVEGVSSAGKTNEKPKPSNHGYGRALSRKSGDMKEGYYFPTRAEYEAAIVQPIITAISDLAACTFRLGQAYGRKEEVTLAGQPANRNSIPVMVKHVVGLVRETIPCHEQALKYGGKKRSSNAEKSSGAFSSLWKYSPKVGQFFAEAAERNPKLSVCKTFKMCQKGEYEGVCQPKMITVLITAYIRANNLQYPENGQYNMPDDLMMKYFSEEIGKARDKQHAKRPSDATEFPGMLKYTTFQSVFGFMHLTDEEKKDDVKAMLKDPEVMKVYNENYQEAQKMGEILKREHQASKPKQKKSSKPKTPMNETMENYIDSVNKNIEQGLDPHEGLALKAPKV